MLKMSEIPIPSDSQKLVLKGYCLSMHSLTPTEPQLAEKTCQLTQSNKLPA